MSRLDQHIFKARNKLALDIFVQALAWAALALGGVLWVAVIVQRVMAQNLPWQALLFVAALLLAVIVSFIYSTMRRPSVADTAVAIDRELGLKEKFSTALYARGDEDPFAQAAVRDAERDAQNVSLYGRFPLRRPKQAIWAALVFLAALLTAWLMPGTRAAPPPPPPPPQAPAPQVMAVKNAREKNFEAQLPKIEQGTQLLSSNSDIKKAGDDLAKVMQTHEGDQLHQKRNALAALQDYKHAMADELARNETFQNAQAQQESLSTMESAQDASSPVGQAQNQIKAGNLRGAMDNLQKAVQQFNSMSPQDQAKMVSQAQQLAKALANSGNDPSVQKRVQQQLQQMGFNQQQAQKMAQTMQRAAQGDKKAQQQMQQMTQQMTQQMNSGQGPTQQQMQQMQSMLTKSQSMINSQVRSQQLSQSAQHLASAMQQAQQSQQQQPSKQSNSSQAHSGQKPAPAGQKQQNQQGQKGQQQSGSSPSQSMQQAQQNMQQQMQQMQSQARDAAAMQSAADAAAQAAADAASGLNPDSNSGMGDQGQNASNKPNPPMGQNGRPGAMAGGQLGKGGAKMGITFAPGGFKQELDPSANIDSGKMLASRYVKAGIDPGKSTAGLRDAAEAAQRDAPDEIEQDRISRDTQQAVKDYFTAMQDQGQ